MNIHSASGRQSDWLETKVVTAPSIRHPQTFLVGAERSGTTVLRLMLDGHSEYAWPGEFDFAIDPIVDDGAWPDLHDYCENLVLHRVFRAGDYRIDRKLAFPDLVRDILEQRRVKAGKPFAGETVHRNFSQLVRIWPDARFIHIVRDPRDVSKSVVGMGWAGNVWKAVELWRDAELEWERLRQSIPEYRRFEVRYEDLISSPKEVLTNICHFLGVAFDSSMLDYPLRSTYSSPDPALVNQWRQKLSEREIRLVESRVLRMMIPRGYEASGLPLLTVSSCERLSLSFQSRIACFRHSVKDFGWRLRLADTFSRRLGIKSWQRSTQRRIDELVVRDLLK